MSPEFSAKDPIPSYRHPMPGAKDPIPSYRHPMPGAKDPVPSYRHPMPGAKDPVPSLKSPVVSAKPPGKSAKHSILLGMHPMRSGFTLALIWALMAPGNVCALQDNKFEFDRSDTRLHFTFNLVGVNIGAVVLKARGMPPWRAAAVSSLMMFTAGTIKEFGVDAFPSGNDLQADILGLGAGMGIQRYFGWESAKEKLVPMVARGRGVSRAPKEGGSLDPSGEASDAALEDSVRWIVRKYSPGVTEERLHVFDKTIFNRYRDFIDSYDISNEYVQDFQYHVELEARVRDHDIHEAMWDMGLQKPGEHLEMQMLISSLSGGGDAIVPAPNSALVENQAFSGSMAGVAARYYVSDKYFTEGSILMLTQPVVVAQVRDKTGARVPLSLTRYSPITFFVGRRWLDWKNVRLTSGLGRSFTMIRGEATGVGFNSGYFVQNWSIANEIQYLPTRWLGFGLKLDYRTKTRFDLLHGYQPNKAFFVFQILAGF